MINLEIYRARIGCHAPHKCKKTRNNDNHNIGLLESMLDVSAGNVFCWFLFCFIYTYVICLLMALMIEITSTVPFFPSSEPAIKSNSIRELLNICIFIIIHSLPKFAGHNKFKLKKRLLSVFSIFNNKSFMYRVVSQYTLWIFC